jgi:hypothetical protein
MKSLSRCVVVVLLTSAAASASAQASERRPTRAVTAIAVRSQTPEEAFAQPADEAEGYAEGFRGRASRQHRSGVAAAGPIERPDSGGSAGCEIESQPFALRASDGHDGRGPRSAHGAASLRIRCGRPTAYAVSFGRGAHYENGRRLRDATTGAYRAYELFLEPGHSVPWDGEPPLRGISDATVDARLTVFARTSADQPLPAGGYTDDVYVDIEF